jgi:hypothetical protein
MCSGTGDTHASAAVLVLWNFLNCELRVDKLREFGAGVLHLDFVEVYKRNLRLGGKHV